MDFPVNPRERRHAPRHRAVAEHGIRGARVRPGYDVAIVDVSARGALVETTRRLLPGALIDLQLEFGDGVKIVRGRVLRSAVSAVQPGALLYRAAVLFDRVLPCLSDGNELPAPPLDERAPATRRPTA
jgi:hypothetical protein